MSYQNNEPQLSYVGGVSFTGLLTLLFIALKLIGIINWSWWWVLSPIWISIALLIICMIVLFIIFMIKDK